MGWQAVCGLGASAVLVSAGLAVRTSMQLGATGNLLLALGVSIAACVGVLLLVQAFTLARNGYVRPEQSQRLRRLLGELVEAAELVNTKGLLALAEARVSIATQVFECGARGVISGADSAKLQEDVTKAAAAQNEAVRTTLGRWASLAQWTAVGVLTVAMTSVGILAFSHLGLFTTRASVESDVASLIALFLVYAGFLLAVLSQQVASRLGSRVREAELSAIMVSETLLHLRAGAGPQMIKSEIERLITPARPRNTDTPVRTAA